MQCNSRTFSACCSAVDFASLCKNIEMFQFTNKSDIKFAFHCVMALFSQYSCVQKSTKTVVNCLPADSFEFPYFQTRRFFQHCGEGQKKHVLAVLFEMYGVLNETDSKYSGSTAPTGLFANRGFSCDQNPGSERRP